MSKQDRDTKCSRPPKDASSSSSSNSSSLSPPPSSPSEPPSRSPSPEVFYWRGQPFTARKGSPELHPFHFTPYEIKVSFSAINWAQEKSEIKIEEPVSPRTQLPEHLATCSSNKPTHGKRKSDEFEDQKDAEPVSSPKKKKQKSVLKPQTRKTLKLIIRKPGDRSFHRPSKGGERMRNDSGIVVDEDKVSNEHKGTTRRSARLMEMNKEHGADEMDYEFTGLEERSAEKVESSEIGISTNEDSSQSMNKTRYEHIGGSKPKRIILRLGMKIEH